MKLTKIRRDGKKLDEHEIKIIAEALRVALSIQGFLVNDYVVNSSRIDLTYNRSSFRINTVLLGYNARLNPYMKYKAGYARTSVPTWDQRVSYNNTVNEILDRYSIECKVKSAHYLIRDGKIKFKETDWSNQKTDWEYDNENRGFKVVSMNEVA